MEQHKMNRQKNDAVFKEIASRCAEQYGAELNRELVEKTLPELSPLGERRVQKAIRKIRFNRAMPIAAAAAAGILLFVALGGAGILFTRNLLSPPQMAEAPSISDKNPVADAAPEDAAETALDAVGGATQDYEIIPLSFTLPQNLTVASTDQDEAKTIYYLENEWQDDIVLTLLQADTLTPPDGADLLSINGRTAYAVSEQGYRKLIFVDDGLTYELTCRHDINTLLALGDIVLT